jgi:hypothetical protein
VAFCKKIPKFIQTCHEGSSSWTLVYFPGSHLVPNFCLPLFYSARSGSFFANFGSAFFLRVIALLVWSSLGWGGAGLGTDTILAPDLKKLWPLRREIFIGTVQNCWFDCVGAFEFLWRTFKFLPSLRRIQIDVNSLMSWFSHFLAKRRFGSLFNRRLLGTLS